MAGICVLRMSILFVVSWGVWKMVAHMFKILVVAPEKYGWTRSGAPEPNHHLLNAASIHGDPSTVDTLKTWECAAKAALPVS